jgi:hypothetical protein
MAWLGRHLSFRHLRVLLLLGSLALTIAWAFDTVQRRRARREWSRPIDVRVVLVTRGGRVDANCWRRGLAELSARLDTEMRRWRGPGPAPFLFRLVGPVRWEGAFPSSPSTEQLPDRLWSALEVFRSVHGIDRAAGALDGRRDVRIYVFSEPGTGEWTTFAEGMGALNGDVAFVRASSGWELVMPLEVIGHELLHTVGASDKYDAGGHPVAPDGLVDPDQVPRYPQSHAEWMAGEVALGPGAGRLPGGLEELSVGAATAREIGWIDAVPQPGLAAR